MRAIFFIMRKGSILFCNQKLRNLQRLHDASCIRMYSKSGVFCSKIGNQNYRLEITASSLNTTHSSLFRSDYVSNISSNVDKKDIVKHEESVADWWDVSGPMMGLHAMNDLRISLIRNGLENAGKLSGENIKGNPKYLSGIKIIEVGCGGGILSEPLTRLGAEVTGIDPSQELVKIAKHHAEEMKIDESFSSAPTYINTEIEEHSLKAVGVYDVVVLSEVIEHVPNKEIFLEACLKTLKPSGSLFLTTPNRSLASWFGSIIIAENVLKLLPKGIHLWDNFITPTELRQLLDKFGCQTVLVNGMMFSLVTKKWLWWPSTMFHYALHAIKLETAPTTVNHQ